MNISKFKLLNGGIDGIKIESVEKVPHDKMLFLDDVLRTRKVPLSEAIREKIQGLRYFYLNLTGHWIAPFQKYIDPQEYRLLEPVLDENGKQPMGQELLHDIWNSTKITGVTFRGGGFVITGTIEVVEGKKLGISTPYITEEDDLSFYLTAVNRISDIMDDLADAIETRALPSPSQQMAISFGETEERVGAMNMEEMSDLMISRLVDKGAIILIDESMLRNEDKKEIGDGTSKGTLNTNVNSVDSHNMPDADENEEEDNSDDDIPEDDIPDDDEAVNLTTDNKPILNKGSLVSGKKFGADLNGDEAKESDTSNEDEAPAGTLEDLEHSENMGITDQQDESDDSMVNEIEAGKKSQW